jgi:hypothetical protein
MLPIYNVLQESQMINAVPETPLRAEHIAIFLDLGTSPFSWPPAMEREFDGITVRGLIGNSCHLAAFRGQTRYRLKGAFKPIG